MRRLETFFVNIVWPAVVGVCVLRGQPAQAASYTITDLGTLPGYERSVGAAINTHGDVLSVVMHDTNTGRLEQRSFVHHGASVTEVMVYPGCDVSAAAINDRGDVVGHFSTPWMIHAFVWRDGAAADVGNSGVRFSSAMGINNAGQAVGCREARSAYCRAALWEPDGRMVDLDAIGGHSWTTSVANSINDAGDIAGSVEDGPLWQGALWQDGEVTILPMPGEVNAAWGHDINNVGQIVGSAITSKGERVFIWQHGHTTLLPALGGGITAVANAINNAGQSVGYCRITSGGEYYATLWQDGRVIDLNTLVPADAAWTLQWASDINDAGQIVGDGLHDGAYRGFLLTPTPEPSTFFIAVLLATLGLRGTRWRS